MIEKICTLIPPTIYAFYTEQDTAGKDYFSCPQQVSTMHATPYRRREEHTKRQSSHNNLSNIVFYPIANQLKQEPTPQKKQKATHMEHIHIHTDGLERSLTDQLIRFFSIHFYNSYLLPRPCTSHDIMSLRIILH